MSRSKFFIVVLFAAFANTGISYAQWSSSGINIWNTNTGTVGIGTTSAVAKKFEIWDGSSAKFTFSGDSCTSGYEVAQTIDNKGYQLNVGLSTGNYKIAINSIDRLKILSNDNFAVGMNSMNSITSGVSNTAIGQYSLNKNTTGYFNLALGYYTLNNNTSGNFNTGLGRCSLNYNTTGNSNSGLGSSSLYNNTTGGYNSALGYGSLYFNSTGSYNVGIGYYAGAYISNGSSWNTTTSNSVFIGSNSKALANAQTNQIVIGYNAIGNGSNTVTLGNDSIVSTFLKGKVGIGTTSLTKKFEIWDGSSAKFTFSGSSCTAGYEVAQTINNTGYSLNVGSSTGTYTIRLNSTDRLKILPSDNFAVGYNALSNTSGSSFNTAIGESALRGNSGGSNNIALGQYALSNIASGSDNVGIGDHAGADGSTETYSVFIGTNSRALGNTQTNQIAIGYNAFGHGSNTVTLGNDSIVSTFLKGNVGIGTGATAPGAKLDVLKTTNTNANDLIANFQRASGPFTGGSAIIRLGYAGTADLEMNASMNGAQGAGIRYGTYSDFNLVNNTTGTFVGGINFITNGSTRMKVAADGNVGIGTTTPISNFEVASSTGAILSITTNRINGSENAPLRPTLDFLGYANENKVRISAKEATYNTHGSTLSMFVNDGASSTSLVERMTIIANGNVGIGTTNPDQMLTVNGSIHAKEVLIDLNAPLADFVFHPYYNLMPLSQVEQYVKTNSHLPEIPSAGEISKNGLSIGEMQNKLLQKVEELTLYVIEQQKEIELLKKGQK